MFMFCGKAYGNPRSTAYLLNEEECALIPWDQATRYVSEFWGQDDEPSDPLWPDIWVKIPPTDLSDRLCNTTSLFFSPLDPVEN